MLDMRYEILDVSVKKGSYKVLEPFCTALLERGLTAEIE